MSKQGIRILDKENMIVSVKLGDFIDEINNGESFYWSILYLYATGDLGEKMSMPVFETSINEAPSGLALTWSELQELSNKFWDLMDILIIGCSEKNQVRRYSSEKEMCESCDVVINKFDSSYWEVFAKNPTLIEKLANKFIDIRYLSTD